MAKMQDIRENPRVPASWASAGIVDARAFRKGDSETIHALSHARPNMVRGGCGVVARVCEYDGPLASWAAEAVDCPTCLGKH